jgi:hypothetical protein
VWLVELEFLDPLAAHQDLLALLILFEQCYQCPMKDLLDFVVFFQLHPRLFVEPNLAPFNPNVCNLGGNFFGNHTRQQLKNV